MTPDQAESLLSPADQAAALKLFFDAVEGTRRRHNPAHPALVALIGAREAELVAHLNPSALSQLTLVGLRAKGLSKRSAQRVRAAFIFAETAVREDPTSEGRITSPRDVDEVMRPRLALRQEEEIWAIFLDSSKRVIHLEHIASAGSRASVMADHRYIARRAIELGAAGVILVHNHPSANPQPSQEDRTFTNKVRLALESVDVPLLDHVIIGRPGHTSMMALGLMTPTARVITVP